MDTGITWDMGGVKQVPGVLVHQRQEDARVLWGPGCDLPKRGSSRVQWECSWGQGAVGCSGCFGGAVVIVGSSGVHWGAGSRGYWGTGAQWGSVRYLGCPHGASLSLCGWLADALLHCKHGWKWVSFPP